MTRDELIQEITEALKKVHNINWLKCILRLAKNFQDKPQGKENVTNEE